MEGERMGKREVMGEERQGEGGRKRRDREKGEGRGETERRERGKGRGETGQAEGETGLGATGIWVTNLHKKNIDINK